VTEKTDTVAHSVRARSRLDCFAFGTLTDDDQIDIG
jgi:hypothetical protein